MSPLGALAPFARRTRPPRGERCELCGGELPAGHPHVLELARRTLCCSCRPCALLFAQPGSAPGRYRTVPDRVLVDPQGPIGEAAWAALEIPVRLAFVSFDSAVGAWTARYPGPAGVTEAAISPGPWAALAAGSRLAACLEPDVEALLVYGRRPAGPLESFLAPIDRCYELVAAVRRGWRGFDGGEEARGAVEAFFAGLRARGRAIPSPLPPGGAA